MKTLYMVLLAVLMVSVSEGQLIRRGGGGGSVDTNVVALKTDLVHNATNPSEMPYFNAAGDTLFSRPFYSAPAWVLDSTVLSLYGTSFNRTWFRTTADSLAVDSLVAVLQGTGTDTVSFRVYWGVSRAAAVDSLTDIKCFSLTTPTSQAQTKVIPPYRMVWVKVTEKDGTPKEAFISLNARRRW